MTDSDDQLIVARAAIDQMIAFAPELARALFGYYAALVDAGFTPQQALELTAKWMALTLDRDTED